MARDIRDEIEGLFKAAAEDPSIGDAPKKRSPTKANTPTQPPPSAPKKQLTQPPASAGAPSGKPRAQSADGSNRSTLPPMASPFAGKERKTPDPTTPVPPSPPHQTLPPGKKMSASTITPELLRRSGASVVTGASIPAHAIAPAPSPSPSPPQKDVTRPPMPASSRSMPAVRAVIPTSPASSATSNSGIGPSPVRAQKKIGANKEVIEYAPDEPLVDHRGRSKPMYKPRSPRPRSWKPSRPIRLLLGLFPGTRLMALESIAQGWPYSALGMLALVPAIFLILNWSANAARVEVLSIDERWLLAHAAAIFVLIGVFELLRLGAYFEERTSGPRVPRILAALTIPAVLVIVGAPRLIPLWPQLVEAAWCSAVVLALGGLAGSAWCLLDGTIESTGGQRTFRIVGLVLIGLLLLGGVLTGVLVPGSLAQLATWARGLGFQALPGMLGG